MATIEQGPSGNTPPEGSEKQQIEALKAKGFDERTIKRFVEIKKRHREVDDEQTPQSRRLEFGKWLYLNGRITK